jgi:hypothetical protein
MRIIPFRSTDEVRGKVPENARARPFQGEIWREEGAFPAICRSPLSAPMLMDFFMDRYG